ncbi:MAG TPA: succinate dehydrogenase cytochrome b subunit [Candidatus Kryptonia bacterium]|nr:succinate dehydrogenase cytochrome b subunit [Candidatus Kryptonia bacterium]
MAPLIRFLTSNIGRKVLMALTGLFLILFLIIHLSGNLLVFKSAEAFNDYSEKLLANELIYVAEIGLLVAFVAHFISGIAVTLQNRAARPIGYAVKRRAGHTSHKSLASTTMILTGLVVLVFVPIHLITFKFGAHYPVAGNPHQRDLYRLVIEEFREPLEVVWYVAAMAIIGFHLWHGFGSGFESLGVTYRKPLRRIGQALAVIIAGGFIIIPVLVFLGR